jgi:hypothetical protein
VLTLQAENLTHTTHIPSTHSALALYLTLLNAYGHFYITQILYQMAASMDDAISRVHNFKITGNFCLQTFMGAKWEWHYNRGVLSGLTLLQRFTETDLKLDSYNAVLFSYLSAIFLDGLKMKLCIM